MVMGYVDWMRFTILGPILSKHKPIYWRKFLGVGLNGQFACSRSETLQLARIRSEQFETKINH